MNTTDHNQTQPTEPTAPLITDHSTTDHSSPGGLSRLEGLTSAQLTQLNTWYREAVSFRKMVGLCREKFGLEIRQVVQETGKKVDAAAAIPIESSRDAAYTGEIDA